MKTNFDKITETEFFLTNKINTIKNLIKNLRENTDEKYVIYDLTKILMFIDTNIL